MSLRDLLIALALCCGSLATGTGLCAQEPPPQSSPVVERATVEARLAVLANPEAEPERQVAAQRSLVRLGPGGIVFLSSALLDDTRPWSVRTGAAWVLGELRSEVAIEALFKAWNLKGSPGTFRVQVAIALSTLGERDPLRSFLIPPQSDKIVVAKAAIAVANLRDKDAVEALRAWEADEDIGAFVVLALGRLGASVDQAVLRELMTEPIFRDQAAVALARLGDRTVMLNLRFALSNPDAFLRFEAVTLIRRFRDKGALKELRKMARDDPDPRVQQAASRAVRDLDRR